MWAVLDPTTSPPLAYFEEVAIVRVPTVKSWRIPVLLLYGGWNPGVPTPGEMLSVAKHWHEEYDADICAFGAGGLDFRVGRPPMTIRDAVKLLREQMLFDPDGFNDMVLTPENACAYAALLRSKKFWTFWWD